MYTITLTPDEADALTTTLGIARTNLKAKAEGVGRHADTAASQLPLITSVLSKTMAALAGL